MNIAIFTTYTSNLNYRQQKKIYDENNITLIPLDYTHSIIDENVQKLSMGLPEEVALDIALRILEFKNKDHYDLIAYIGEDLLIKDNKWIDIALNNNKNCIEFHNEGSKFWVIRKDLFSKVLLGEIEFNDVIDYKEQIDIEILKYEYEKDIMDLSILITAYQSQDFIEETLDSIINQTAINRLNYEIIIGVDACKETLDKLKEIRHKYPFLKILMMDENKGTYITRNTLIDEAKYENILFFDSDDIMKEEMIEEIMNVYNRGDLIRYKRDDLNGGLLERRKTFCYGTFFIKKKAFEKLGGFLSNRFSCDAEFLQRAIFSLNIYLLNKYLINYRISDNQLTNIFKLGGEERKKWKRENIKDFYNADEIFIEKEINTFKYIN